MNLKKLTRIILLVAVLLLLSIVPVNAVVFNAAFDSDFYVNCYPDLKAAFGNDANAAYNHYLTYGIKEGRIASPVFDVKTYIANYPDLQAAFGDNYEAAYNHFLTNGMKEGRLASNAFNVQVYIANYPDLQAAFGNDVAGAYNHYLNFGMAEGRVCGALNAGATAPEDHVHDFKLDRIIIGATCQVDGEGIYKCSCGEEETRVIPASDEYHNYIEQMVNGVKVKVCTICNNTKIEAEEGVTHIHKYKVISEVDSTCQEEGLRTKQCQNPGCDERIVKEVIAKKPHVSTTKAGEGYVIRNATKCTADGLELVYCTNIVDGKVCNERFERTIPAHNYDEGVVAVKPTCTEKGSMKFTCKDCGATKFEDIDALGHDFGTTEEEPFTLIPATCEKTGLAEKVCKRCKYEEKVTLQALGHDLDYKKDNATAELADRVYLENGKIVLQEGAKKYALTKNETTGEYESNAINVPANKTSDCKYDIAEVIICGNYVDTPSASNPQLCSEEKGMIINIVKKATGHVAKTGTETREGIATIDITKNGVVVNGVYDYSVDYDYVRDEKTGEIVFEKGAVVDCSHEKIKIVDCKYCGEGIVVVEARKPHTGNVKAIPASCDKPGYTQTSCTTCNKIVIEQTAEKETGHNYSYVKETCTEPAHVKCTKCAIKLNADQVKAEASKNVKVATDLKAILVKAGILTSSQDLSALTSFKGATKHKFVGTVVLDETDPTKGTVYCEHKCCQKLIPVKVAIDDKAPTGTITVLDNQGVETAEEYNVVVAYDAKDATKIVSITLATQGSGSGNTGSQTCTSHVYTGVSLTDGDESVKCANCDTTTSLSTPFTTGAKTVTIGTKTYLVTDDSKVGAEHASHVLTGKKATITSATQAESNLTMHCDTCNSDVTVSYTPHASDATKGTITYDGLTTPLNVTVSGTTITVE